ncbi:threonine/serine exporter family protein [Paenibacillus hexagrammi]|uniref:Threonine/serine exporter family protein n=1 Tax=Paenibacillus hexagrammi TaxID=2908839 RepID=A0ABY3SL90_9BACL|nr:threonine/serine exporter family protein [Paenibacillus sp. YPD9-1]UJF34607.1 threonine/serine exporter family protein [Paenibacillus sp. YPD9-1]
MMMVEQLIVSFIASAAFAVLFHVPRATLLQCGFVGMLGWLVYLLAVRIPMDPIAATLIASFLVTVTSQLLAKWYKTPIIVFSVSGIIPLVPGGLAYDAMRNVVENQYDAAVQLSAKAFLLSGAIAMGLVFSEVINHVIRKSRI